MAVSETTHASEGMDTTGERIQSRTKSKKTGPVRWIMGVVVRLCIWYALLTPFFRCPSKLSELNESSPRVCKPYLIVRSHVEPHLRPYYDTYAAPYVDIARPYASAVNEHVYVPAAKLTKDGYDRYGAPALEQAKAYGAEHWEAHVVPHLELAQDAVSDIYTAKVDPYVQPAVQAVSPYYTKANDVMATTYKNYVVPFYVQATPFIGKTYDSGQQILTTTVFPYAQGSWLSAVYFANNELWPRITGLYSENVEPQLVKIGERLASYREEKQPRTAMEENYDSLKEKEVTSSSVERSYTSSVEPSTSSTKQTPTQTSLSPAEETAQLREKIESDLQTWQEKFDTAAHRSTEDFILQVEEISVLHANQKGVEGKQLAAEMDTVVSEKIAAVKSRMNSLAASLPYEDRPEEEANAQNELIKDIKGAAISIKERAQAVREWQASYNEDLLNQVSETIDTTTSILDNVRDLGLQEIGMRWATMDGVTYRDWAKYYALKKQLGDYKGEITLVGMQNAKLEEARNMANEILNNVMGVAEDTAKELARLKEVGAWKIAAREDGDDFSSRSEPPPTLPKPAKEEPAETPEEPATAESSESDHHQQPVEEPAQTPEESASAESSSEAADVNDDELGLNDEILPNSQESSSDATPQESVPSVQDVLESANKQIDEAVDSASTIFGNDPNYVDVAREVISEASLSAGSAISEAVYSAPTTVVDATQTPVVSAAQEQKESLESAISELGMAIDNAQARLLHLVSSASSLGSEAVKTATVESVKSEQTGKDEL